MPDNSIGTGFLCLITFLDKSNPLTVLITNNHILGKDDISIGKIINFDINDENFKIKIDNSIKTYTNKKYDITFIEIKKNVALNINKFLEIDYEIFEGDLVEKYKKKSIYIFHYGDGEIKYSIGIIKSIGIDNYTIEHMCETSFGSSGSPIINYKNNKVIGVHKGACKNYNLGTLLRLPIEKFYKEKKLINENKKEEKNNDSINIMKINSNINNFNNEDEKEVNNKINYNENDHKYININNNNINNKELKKDFEKINSIENNNISLSKNNYIKEDDDNFFLFKDNNENDGNFINNDMNKNSNNQNNINNDNDNININNYSNNKNNENQISNNNIDNNSHNENNENQISNNNIDNNSHNENNENQKSYKNIDNNSHNENNENKISNNSINNNSHNENQISNNSINNNSHNKNEDNCIDSITIIYSKLNIKKAGFSNFIFKFTSKEKFSENKLFGETFVKNNANNCKIIINGKEFNLSSSIESEYNDSVETIEIKLKGINRVIDMTNMFIGCLSLCAVPDIDKLDTSNVVSVSDMFCGCKSLLSLPDSLGHS